MSSSKDQNDLQQRKLDDIVKVNTQNSLYLQNEIIKSLLFYDNDNKSDGSEIQSNEIEYDKEIVNEENFDKDNDNIDVLIEEKKNDVVIVDKDISNTIEISSEDINSNN